MQPSCVKSKSQSTSDPHNRWLGAYTYIMKKETALIAQLQSRGERITPIRRALIAIFNAAHNPVTPQQLLAELLRKNLLANKTTVYRQLETLVKYNIVHEVHFADRITRYELTSETGHHHHLVCVECGRIEDISFPTDLREYEKAIRRKSKFTVLQHSLEFFGLCQHCSLKQKNILRS